MSRALYLVGLIGLVVGCGSKRREDPPPARKPPPPSAPAESPPPEPVAVAKAAPGGWTTSVDLATGQAHATSVAIDSKGNVVLAISFEKTLHVGTETFEGGEGGLLLLAVPLAGSPIKWTKLVGANRSVEEGHLALDAQDNVFLSASLRGTVNLGGGSLASAGNDDIVLAKFGPDGAHQWSHRIGGPDPDRAAGLAVDPKGNVVIAGYYAHEVDFGGKKLTGKFDSELFVARYSPDGKLVFANRLSGGGETTSEMYGVTIDPKGNAIAVGAYADKLDIGGKPLAGIKGKNLQSFVVAFAPSGSLAWSTAYGPGSMTMADAVLGDAAGNTILAGADMDMPVDDNNMVSFEAASGKPTTGSMKSFVAQLGPDHKPRWMLPVSGIGMGDSIKPAFADNGDILVVGDAASAPFGDASLADAHAFFGRVSAEGKLVSVRAIPGARTNTAYPTLASRGADAVVVVQTGEDSRALTMLRP